MGPNYVEHGCDVYPADASGVPWTAAYIQAIEEHMEPMKHMGHHK